jgi:hypothetical protein
MGNQEKERQSPDDIRTLVVRDLEQQRNTALEIIEQQQSIAAIAQDQIDAINNILSTPTIVLEVDYLDVEYDKYTYSESVVRTEQFAMNEKSIGRTISECADILNGNKDTQLSKVAIETIVSQQLTLIPLQNIDEWRHLLATHTRRKYGDQTEGMYGGK